MQRFAVSTSRAISTRDQLFRRQRRYFSQLAQFDSSLSDNEESAGAGVCGVPRIPPFDHSPPAYTGPTADEILRKRKEFLSPSLFCFYKKPLNVVHGKMQYLFDEDGRRYLDGFGGLVIADEVQSGFGRTGSNFWGFQNQGILPDIVTLAKGIGNGIPLGAVVTTPEIAKVLTRRSYFNTFGGNPVCTAAGHAVLKVIETEKLQENAHLVGSYIKQRLLALKDKHHHLKLTCSCLD